MSDTSPKDHWTQSLSPDLFCAFLADMQGSPVTSGATRLDDPVMHSRYADHATDAAHQPMLAGANEEEGSINGPVLYSRRRLQCLFEQVIYRLCYIYLVYREYIYPFSK